MTMWCRRQDAKEQGLVQVDTGLVKISVEKGLRRVGGTPGIEEAQANL